MTTEARTRCGCNISISADDKGRGWIVWGYVRGVGAKFRLPGGVVVRYEHEAPGPTLPGTPPWYSASKRGAWNVPAQDREQIAAVLAHHYTLSDA